MIPLQTLLLRLNNSKAIQREHNMPYVIVKVNGNHVTIGKATSRKPKIGRLSPCPGWIRDATGKMVEAIVCIRHVQKLKVGGRYVGDVDEFVQILLDKNRGDELTELYTTYMNRLMKENGFETRMSCS